MRIITRKTAKEKGLKRYFTGQPCKHGHVAERYTKSDRCVECAQDSLDKFYEDPKNREIRSKRSTDYMREYYKTKTGRENMQRAQFRYNKTEKRRAYMREYMREYYKKQKAKKDVD